METPEQARMVAVCPCGAALLGVSLPYELARWDGARRAAGQLGSASRPAALAALCALARQEASLSGGPRLESGR